MNISAIFVMLRITLNSPTRKVMKQATSPAHTFNK